MFDGKISNINNNICQVETLLDNIFDSFCNDDFEDVPCTAYVYKNRIRFVPSSMKERVDALLAMFDINSQSKNNVLTKKR